jgi:hypothetical protein
MSLIEEFASLDDAEILALAQVRGYQRKINGKMTTVKPAERGGPAKAQSGKPEDQPKIDDILSQKVPIKDLTEIQRYLIKQRAKAYKDIVDRHKKLRGTITDEYSQARDVLLAASQYYNTLADQTQTYDQREAARLNMATKRLALRNTVRQKLRLQAATTPQQNGDLPPVW